MAWTASGELDAISFATFTAVESTSAGGTTWFTLGTREVRTKRETSSKRNNGGSDRGKWAFWLRSSNPCGETFPLEHEDKKVCRLY